MLFALLLLHTRAEVVWKGCREREKRLTINIKLFFIPWFVLGPSQEVDGNSFEFTKEYVKLS